MKHATLNTPGWVVKIVGPFELIEHLILGCLVHWAERGEMYMQKKWSKMKKDSRAEMGVGTMIIFIAMVLVAAVAASVLISTANSVREQAQSTGEQAITNVASGFVVQDVIGVVDTDDYQNVEGIIVYIRLAVGSPDINMNNVVISLIAGDNNMMLSMGTAASDSAYETDKTLDISSNTWNDTSMATSHVVGQGDLIKITINNTAGDLDIGFNEPGVIKIIPAYGQVSLIEFTTAESFTTEYVSLA
jgi:flagellin FlaB